MTEGNINQYVSTIEAQLREETIRRMQAENKSAEQSAFSEKKDPSTIVFQIDPSEDLDKLYHLLKGDVMVDGNWAENGDNNQKIFTDLGIREIMNKLHPYLSKQITLGNYSEEEINDKMIVFGTLLTYFILNRAEDFFHYPKSYEMYENMIQIIEEDPEAYPNINKDTLYSRCEVWSKNELDKRINHFKITINAITDLVHAAYVRALKGATHKGITRNYHVSENNPNTERYGDSPDPAKKGLFGRWKGK